MDSGLKDGMDYGMDYGIEQCEANSLFDCYYSTKLTISMKWLDQPIGIPASGWPLGVSMISSREVR